MADTSSYRPSSGNPISEDDPFAELTRIMGFDPREKVHPQPAQPQSDFGIDLEKEMLGDFGIEEPVAQQTQQAYAPVQPAAPSIPQQPASIEQLPEPTDDLDLALSEFDLDLEGELDPRHLFAVDETAAPQPVVAQHARPVWDEPSLADAQDFAAPSETAVPGFESYEAPAQSFAQVTLPVEPFEQAAMQGQPFEQAAIQSQSFEQAAPEHEEWAAASDWDEEIASVDLDATDDGFEAAMAVEHEDEGAFERQLYDLLAGSDQPVAEAQPVSSDESWIADLDLPETIADEPVPAAADAAAQHGAMARDWRDQALAWQQASIAEPVRNEIPVEPVREQDVAQAESPIVDDVAQPFDVWSAGESADWRAAEADELVQPEPDQIEMLADELAADLAEEAIVPASTAEELVGDDATAQTPDMEPEAMQPFDERAFDSALADEMANASGNANGNWQPAGRSLNDQLMASLGTSQHAAAAGQRSFVAAPSMQHQAPDIETLEFTDERVTPSDDLDLPAVEYGDDPVPSNELDDFDAEFASAFNALNDEQTAQPARAEASAERSAPSQWERSGYGQEFEFGSGAMMAGAAAAASAAGIAGAKPQASHLSRVGTYEPEPEEAYAPQAAYAPKRRRAPVVKRSYMLAAAVAAIALVGGIGAYALSGGVGEGGIALVRADNDPVKVRPENPGGAVVPNQDNVVYDRVGSGQPLGGPAQDRLVSTSEEPVDLAAADQQAATDSLSALSGTDDETDGIDDGGATDLSAKDEDRLLPATDEASKSVPQEMVALAPRKVRTMIVKPDGTLEPREDDVAATPAVANAPAPAPTPVATRPAQAQTPAPVSQAPVAPAPVAQQPAPAPQPAPAQVAAAEPTLAPAPIEAAAAPSGWSVQIASQPTEAGAQASYDNLSRRYASVLSGKNMSIVKAEIAGKGTYYRVRVAASSRAEANQLCTSYKNAGGSCFVSQ